MTSFEQKYNKTQGGLSISPFVLKYFHHFSIIILAYLEIFYIAVFMFTKLSAADLLFMWERPN